MPHTGSRTIKLCVLMFLHGATIMAILFCVMMSNYENRLFDGIVNKVTNADMDQQNKALTLLNHTHELLSSRLELFRNVGRDSFRERFFASSDVHLMDAQGACGSFTGVLGRLLQRAGFEVRIAQMKCADQWGCHINLEAKIDGRYVALDPLYNLAFTRPDGELANYQEIGLDWQYYQTQTPDNYYPAYQYEDVRYTNWQKIPVIMPLIKMALDVILGEKANTISVRSYVLNVYFIYAVLLSLFYLMLLFVSIKFLRNQNKLLISKS